MFFKICGLRRQEDLDAAQALGFALCGFIFHAQSPRSVDPQEVAALNSRGMRRVGVFVDQDARATLAAVRLAGLDYVQLHGEQDRSILDTLARALGRERLIRVLWPQRYASTRSLQKALDEAGLYCGMVLLDNGLAGGGHGARLDLDLLQDLNFPGPWLLAGGLDAEALDMVTGLPAHARPSGLDFNSGLEVSPGVKDRGRMAAVVRRARALGLGPGIPDSGAGFGAASGSFAKGRSCAYNACRGHAEDC